MSEFNYFGLTTNDIVESFNGALVTDFASNSKSGAEIIANELELAEGELIGLLTPKVIRKFYNTEGVMVNISGSGIIVLPTELPYDSSKADLEVYYQPKKNINSNCNELFYTNALVCGTNSCNNCGYPDMLKAELSGMQILNYSSNYEYYAVYSVNSAFIEIRSLQDYIRNRVCCILGNNLYANADNVWKLVDTYCKRAEAFVEKIDSHYVPGELKKMKWVNPLVTGSISSIRVNRS